MRWSTRRRPTYLDGIILHRGRHVVHHAAVRRRRSARLAARLPRYTSRRHPNRGRSVSSSPTGRPGTAREPEPPALGGPLAAPGTRLARRMVLRVLLGTRTRPAVPRLRADVLVAPAVTAHAYSWDPRAVAVPPHGGTRGLDPGRPPVPALELAGLSEQERELLDALAGLAPVSGRYAPRRPGVRRVRAAGIVRDLRHPARREPRPVPRPPAPGRPRRSASRYAADGPVRSVRTGPPGGRPAGVTVTVTGDGRRPAAPVGRPGGPPRGAGRDPGAPPARTQPVPDRRLPRTAATTAPTAGPRTCTTTGAPAPATCRSTGSSPSWHAGDLGGPPLTGFEDDPPPGGDYPRPPGCYT